MLNPALQSLPNAPFPLLARLLADVAPAPKLEPIVMAIGEPRHVPPALLAATIAREAAGWGSYPPLNGTSDLRAAIADWLTQRYALAAGALDPARHVLPVAGTREALYMCHAIAVGASKAGARPAVLVPNPYYQAYAGAAAMSGAEVVYLPARAAAGFLPTLDDVDEALWARTALMYLGSPANPQGAVADAAYLGRAVALARRHDFVLALDECYAEIYTDAPPPGGLAAAWTGDGTFDNVVVFHSLSKRSSAPGLRSGFVAGDARIIDAFVRLRGYGGATLSPPVQAASAALWRDEAHVAANRALYRRKFDMAEHALAGRAGFYRPKGGFYLWLDVGDGEASTLRLWREGAIRAFPGAYFGFGEGTDNPGQRYIRLSLVHDEATTAEALARLARLV